MHASYAGLNKLLEWRVKASLWKIHQLGLSYYVQIINASDPIDIDRSRYFFNLYQ